MPYRIPRAAALSSIRVLATLTAGSLVFLSGMTAEKAAAAESPQATGSKAATPEQARTLPPAIDQASWIWHDGGGDVCQLRTTFSLDQKPETAQILITADNGYELFVNGTLVGFDVGAGKEVWSSLERFDIRPQLTRGINVIGVRCLCLGGGRGLVAAIRIEQPEAGVVQRFTDANWKAAADEDPVEYSHPEFVEGPDWTAAQVLGPMGMAPWGRLKYAGSQGGRRLGALPAEVSLVEPTDEFDWPAGLAYIGDDCSVYKPLRGDAWGVVFRINNWSRAYTEFDIPCPSKIGRTLWGVCPLGPDATPRRLLDAGNGAIGSPCVSYDGQSILVAMAREGDSFFHIYRVPVQGGAPIQLTDGPFHDIDPAELPDGRIVFSSTRMGSYEEYHNPPSRCLFVMQADGQSIQPLTFTPIFDNEPKLMADGRIAFIRTDNFFDRAKVETQIHVIRPDGTDGHTEFGTDVGADYGVRLRRLGYGSPAPMPNGDLACISTQGNIIASPGASEAEFQRLPGGLGDLAALPDGRLLATVLRREGAFMKSDVIAVIDPRDNALVRVFEAPDGSVHSPVFLGPRPRPPMLADTVAQDEVGKPGATGFLICQNVRFTRKLKADWDQIRAIRVLAARPLTNRSSHSHIVHAGHETVELGTVPLAPDGSFAVEVPADIPLALQAVDAEGRSELNEMSWIFVRPGERRACIGCHAPRRATPMNEFAISESMLVEPLKLTGQGVPHRFRGNNAGVTGMMDLQFERFRETASLNAHEWIPEGVIASDASVSAIREALPRLDKGLRVSVANHLALHRDRRAAPALADLLEDDAREVRVAAAMALAACGTRESVSPLLEALADREDALVVQAAALALENLTGHRESASPFTAVDQRRELARAWQTWYTQHSWDAIEAALIDRMRSEDRARQRRAIVALGHIGGDAARAALRAFVSQRQSENPYPPFEQNNRTDRFTFSADSPLNPRTLQEAVRAIGHLQDRAALPLLGEILRNHTDPTHGNLFLAEAAVEALGTIGGEASEELLVETFQRLGDYVQYVGWYSDHPALYACHASPLHARLIVALDRLQTPHTDRIVPQLIRSVPTDPDRALFPENDTYEVLVGRVIRRSGRSEELIETCLALLGDPQATATEDLQQALSSAFAAWAGTPAADNRAAQILSLMCRDAVYEPRVRAAYERYRAMPEDPIDRPLGNPTWIPQRHWVLFYLGRALGNLGHPRSIETLLASLVPELNEARHGRPDPAEPNIHFLQLEYTPCWRAAAAWALGKIGEVRAAPRLFEIVRDLDNATDTRHAAAEALHAIADPDTRAEMQRLAEDYPEVSVKRALLTPPDAVYKLIQTSPGG